MSGKHSDSKMEPTLGSIVCLICFETTEKFIFVPSDAQTKLFSSCNKYLHSTLTKDTLKDIQLNNENKVPLCKSCFDSALELTQLSEQLATTEKDISDLTVAFSMTVFHRRSQVYSIGQNYKSSSIIEFNEACLPPNLFSMKNEDHNIHPSKNNQEMNINILKNHTDIMNVNSESSDIQFDNLSENPLLVIINNDAEIPFNKENLDYHSRHPSINHLNIEPISEMGIVHPTNETNERESKKCADPKNGVKLTMSDLLKSVTMPEIILERIKIVGNKFEASVVMSNPTKCEPRQNFFDETLCKDDESPAHSCEPEITGDRNILKCFYCEKTFALEWLRNRHHKTHAGSASIAEKFSYQSNQKSERTHTGGKRFKCGFCEKRFFTNYTLKHHERTHTGEKPFECSFCEKKFSELSTLTKHTFTHTGEKPFECSLCEKKFSQLSTLNKHKLTHTGEKPFECSLCEKKFSQLSTLNNHKITHGGEKRFKCSFCGRRFGRNADLKFHEMRHTGEKPYKCIYCEKTFRRFRLKNKHVKIKHSEQMSSLINQKISEKPFKCAFCEKRFTANATVKIHERTHTGEKPFECEFCEKKFAHPCSLTRHKMIHTKEKPFKCSFCDRRFNLKGNLKVHERVHTGEKPYKCSYCEKTFRDSNSKRYHQKRHREQMLSSINKSCNEESNSLAYLKHHDAMNSTFSHDHDKNINEKIHSREDETTNENFIVGI